MSGKPHSSDKCWVCSKPEVYRHRALERIVFREMGYWLDDMVYEAEIRLCMIDDGFEGEEYEEREIECLDCGKL